MTIDLLPPSQQDSAWKDVLDAYFQEFMEFFFPALASEIDWAAGYTVLDKELQSITIDAMIGKRLVDKLIQVQSLRGEKYLVPLHIEVQGNQEIPFPERLYQYNYKLYDRYQKPVLTLAILTDGQSNWRPDTYQVQVLGMKVLAFHFQIAKLLDYADQIETLETTTNPFGIIVLAQLAALKTQRQANKRFKQKFALARRLYDRGLGRDDTLNLYRFIDYVLALPKALAIRYNEHIHQLEEERTVSYITSIERMAIKNGYKQGKQEGRQEGECGLLLTLLEHKFKRVPEKYRQQLTHTDAQTLLRLGKRVLEAQTLEDIFKELAQ